MSADAQSPALGDLVQALTALDYGTSLVLGALGREGHAEAMSGNPGAAVWHLDRRTASGAADSRSATLTAAFFLREPVEFSTVARVLGDDLADELVAAGILEAVPETLVRSQIDVRPVSHDRHGDTRPVLVASDPDASASTAPTASSVPTATRRSDHVPGVGQAPLTLLNQVPASPTESLLDLGTGSGVLALLLPAAHTVATDVNTRALDYARASERSVPGSADGDATPVDFREGSWFEPVAGESFSRIVSNPPFVVGPAEDGQIYRDSGLELDGASRTVVEGAAEHLAPGGTAHLLGAWVTSLTESPANRVASWIPSEGIRAWVVQRDEVTPSVYVRTWLSDGSVDLRSPEGRRRCSRWLDYLQENDVARIGMGYVHLERIDGPSEVTFEVLDTPDLEFFGDEVEEHFTRAAWLAGTDAERLLDARFQVRPGLARETVELATIGTEDIPTIGFHPEVLRLTRTEGPRYSHEIDAPLSAVVAGLSPQGLSLRDTAELYCAVNGLDEEEFTTALVPLIVDLVRHGLVLPAELIENNSADSADGADGADGEDEL
ncbi:MAG TPA: methyltransferase [Candidatus Corynebacterium avicola]|uniref:Methyltransferase n=1 Tax=Candidatus Corynebacterium avicola TaxID=2838527 RepID=A0A9D1UM69_9CORY|nr:methyltransferase [Candidatus Corynebacterium avicola]